MPAAIATVPAATALAFPAGWLLCRARAALTANHPGRVSGALSVGVGLTLPFAVAGALPGHLILPGCLLAWTLALLALVDLDAFRLPDLGTVPLALCGLAVVALGEPDRLPLHMVGAAAGYLAFRAVSDIYRLARGREGLGLGDAKLLAAAGAWVSWEGLPAVALLASGTAVLAMVGAGLAGRRVAPDTPIPFGPFLALATWAVWTAGALHAA